LRQLLQGGQHTAFSRSGLASLQGIFYRDQGGFFITMTKICTKCNQEKDLDSFNVQNGRLYNRSSNCKDCKAEYRKKNSKSLQRKKAEYYKENKAACIERSVRWYEENKQLTIERSAQRRINDPEGTAEYMSNYSKKNKDDLTIKRRQYVRKRRNEDESFKIKSNISRRIHHALNGQNKSDSTTALLGCNYEHARAHIESQFTDGMSWSNWSMTGWHVDHIIPCASFDLTDPEQQRQCFHYTNLQPLWAIENIKKGDKMPHELSTTKRCHGTASTTTK
tara:strand:+ start:172 stop:1005 length:834 start_codon:yes stop_codon:yes gene_type:complete